MRQRQNFVKTIKFREAMLTILLRGYPQTSNTQETLVWFIWHFFVS